MSVAKQIRALLAIEDPLALSAVRGYLRRRGDVAETSALPNLHTAVRAGNPDIVFLQVKSDAAPLATLLQLFPTLALVIVSSPSPMLAFTAARLGARALLTLPLDSQMLAGSLSPVLDSLPHKTVSAVQAADPPVISFAERGIHLFDSSPCMAEVRETIEKVADTSATVLIRGESGVGKEIAAQLIFSLSSRSQKPFIKVNCAAIPNELLESELFGYEPGAFTGALRAKPGKFELADGGTLFLDEIGEMHPALQAKLLHVLQDGSFARLGAKRDMAVDVRVLCATNKSLEELVAAGSFREDLFYRVNVITVHIPPLRERRNEIPGLIREFVDRYAELYGRIVEPLGPSILRVLMQYAWPGNIRELENICKRYVIVGNAQQIIREISQHTQDGRRSEAQPALPEPTPVRPSLLEIGQRAAWLAERQAIRETLTETKWNRREAARRLRVSYKALRNKISRMEEEDGGHN